MTPDIPPTLCAARRSLDNRPGIQIPGDWVWSETTGQWSLECSVTVDTASAQVPGTTGWYALVAPGYPWGKVRICPAKQNGLVSTFQHQAYNGMGNPDAPWRSGAPCLDTSVHVLGRSGLDREPVGMEGRLLWHLERLLLWLEAAAACALTKPGEPFELPAFPCSSDLHFVFSESEHTFILWDKSQVRAGSISIAAPKWSSHPRIVRTMLDLHGDPVYSPVWGDALSGAVEGSQGVWLRLDTTPHLEPWQAPMTWEELRLACDNQQIDLNALLKQIAPRCRDGRRVVLAIGYPIPAVVDGPIARLHWQALLLPALTRQGQRVKGFRPGETGYWVNDRTQILKGSTQLEWIKSENWDTDQITSRGKLPPEFANRNVLLIGAGALGAPIAQLLIRAGVKALTIVDPGSLDIGNLTRHTLTMLDISTAKVNSLAYDLRLSSPHATVHPVYASFPYLTSDDLKRASECNLVIDCTGEDAVIASIAGFDWSQPCTTIVSLSLGIEAQRLFCYSSTAQEFRPEQFWQAVSPWIELQAEKYSETEFPRDGIGCWHPVFPARVDDVWLLATCAIKDIERTIRSGNTAAGLVVYEQSIDDDGYFIGLRRIDPRATT